MSVDVEHFRQMLVEERQRVVDALEYLHADKPGASEDEDDETPMDDHIAENAAITLDREIDSTLEENSESVLLAIDAALARVAAGTYGICENCGRPISVERLEALPYATQCIDCKRKERR